MRYFRRSFIKKLLGLLGIFTFGGIAMEATKKSSKNIKKLKTSYNVKKRHWVGNGFYVHSLLRPSEELNKYISPFILMDYASPNEFSKTNQRRGIGEHPHRGFETVTFAYQGEIEHRDSSGGGGVIKPGDVQWMTAGSGIVHDEFHSDEFSQRGGKLEMVQIWVNLPKKNKMTKPKYQGIESKNIPVVSIDNDVKLRVIAGEFEGNHGPSSTFTSINIYDIKSRNETDLFLKFKGGTNTIILIMSGVIELEKIRYKEQSALIFEREGEGVSFKASKDFKALVLNGAPIDEPMIAHGPFVMNTREEIIKAINDYENGNMGTL